MRAKFTAPAFASASTFPYENGEEEKNALRRDRPTPTDEAVTIAVAASASAKFTCSPAWSRRIEFPVVLSSVLLPRVLA
jgi:hypothetical protein